ncbi:SDR family oxidoreductase [Halobacillus sp. ACCC02827]|uniref:SDR family NAD(P)-dependent oxidoreductase n=1 Tax=Bacillaceae TaxID=186817 RepID=UPI0002A4E281|nr:MULTISPECIES: SDR family oxidoreductase [Bacillaceae]ELK48860.1 short-chain dehydrogenase/reductase family protein [Halobacillus sp. BAB-2008]QHT45810.1 SDR family oxidoreductase [Bacillus sp. SB49]WJE16612.1 SDR family oxidoreductase [Halobacillus sp. ACCC02827]
MKPTALITGASGGIGYELARLFAKSGYNLIVVARSEARLEALKQELDGHPVTIIVQDLSEPGAAQQIYDRVKELGLTITVLVNNAGFGLNGIFDELPLADQQQMLQVNVNALTELTHLFLPEIKAARFRSIPKGILNVASTAAFQPGPRMAVYYASKAYVLSFSEALVEECRDTSVTITTLCPGATETEFFKRAKAEHTKLVYSTMKPETVAKSGFLGFVKGKRVVIPGMANQGMAYASKLLPRSLAAKLAHYVDR